MPTDRLGFKFIAAVVASGLLLAASFPSLNYYPLAWIAFVPLLLVMRQRPFAAGFSTGLVFFAAVLYWLNTVMTTYGGLQSIFSFLAYFFLVAYLAVYFGLATWMACRLETLLKLPYLFTLPPLWVALEYLRSWLFTGFPWAVIGYSQQDFSLAIQSCDVTGIYGVSLMLMVVNCAIAGVISQPKSRLTWFGVAATVAICISHFGYGVWRESQPLEQRDETLRVALIQGNIDQEQKWAADKREYSVDRYRSLSLEAARQQPDLLIWPEAATPFFLQDQSELTAQVKILPRQLQTPLLVGSPAYNQLSENQYQYFNSAFLLSTKGERLGRSDKNHLVPFGEYVPLGSVLSFINKLVSGVGDFSPGKVQPLPLNNHQLGVLICYEAIFPELARDYVRRGSDLLVNLTNDAWFGRSSAPWQLLAMTRFRAIENRIWIARVANTGVSALISPAGRVTLQGPIFVPLQLVGDVGMGAEATFYTRFGDIFAYICLVISGIFLVIVLWDKGRLSSSEKGS